MNEPALARVFGPYRVAITRSRPLIDSRDVVFDSIVTDPDGIYAAIRIENVETTRSVLVELRTAQFSMADFLRIA